MSTYSFINIQCNAKTKKKCSGGLYEEAFVQKIIDRADEVEESGGKLSASLHASGSEDMSVMAMQRLNDQYVY